MVTLRQQEDGGYMLLWKRYVNKMAAMRFLHLQQYSHRLNLLYFFLSWRNSKRKKKYEKARLNSNGMRRYDIEQCHQLYITRTTSGGERRAEKFKESGTRV